MGSRIKDVYIVHHSHTDIGYTDLQEQIVYNQVNNIRNVVSIIKNGCETGSQEKDFKWNCETYFCVEQFLKSASEVEKADFFELVRKGNIGISATYLNGTDLTDVSMLNRKTSEMQEIFTAHQWPVKVAMNADINGISLGARDVLLNNGVEFLFTNIHTHHGMYPLYQNQTPYFWENEAGKRLLVWSGEHYNLGNALGIVFNKNVNYMTESYFGRGGTDEASGVQQSRKKECSGADKSVRARQSEQQDSSVVYAVPDAALESLRDKLGSSIAEYEESGYPYDFYITSVSGVFSDNAPANPAVIATVNAFNRRFGEEVALHMVTLQELYDLIREKTADAPVYRGAMNDWWGNGVGSTPYAVKHYKEALRLSHLCDRLEEKTGVRNEALAEEGARNALLYAEHTWGHSATITNPYDTMVTNLDIRKTSYAARAHEAAAMRKNEQCHLLGDILRYYNDSGEVKIVSTSSRKGVFPVEFYVETGRLPAVKVTDKMTGEELKVQLSSHPRGVLISFLAEFEPGEEKLFAYEEVPAPEQGLYTRTAWIGSERVRDIVNDYDRESYKLPYGLENDWFRISWKVGEGITSFYNKKSATEMLKPGRGEGDSLENFFTPVYENTEIRKGVYAERARLGRNIRGLHAEQYQGDLKDILILDHGPVFDRTELVFDLEGTRHSSVIIKMYRQLPRIEFTYRIAKTLSEDIESIYLPLSLNLPGSELHIHNGGVAMRPGIDQIPGSNMEYYIADEGLLYQNGNEGILINTLDTPLLYMGEMESHPILLCNTTESGHPVKEHGMESGHSVKEHGIGSGHSVKEHGMGSVHSAEEHGIGDGRSVEERIIEENNRRPIYSWIMNNTWETNFKMDLSGFGEFRYMLELQEGTLEENLTRLSENDLGMVSFITG